MIGEFWPQSGLVGLWHLNGNSNDSSGNGNNGTDTAITYSLANGRFGQGAGFDGTTSKIVLPNNASLKVTSAFSVLAWIKTTASTGYPHFFSNCQINTSDYSGFDLHLDGSNGKAVFEIFPTNGGVTVNAITGNSIINDGNWHLLIGVYNGTNLNIYKDGKSDATPVASGVPQYDATSYPTIGAAWSNGSYSGFYTGAEDEIALFSRALSASEIRKWYAWARGRYI